MGRGELLALVAGSCCWHLCERGLGVCTLQKDLECAHTKMLLALVPRVQLWVLMCAVVRVGAGALAFDIVAHSLDDMTDEKINEELNYRSAPPKP